MFLYKIVDWYNICSSISDKPVGASSNILVIGSSPYTGPFQVLCETSFGAWWRVILAGQYAKIHMYIYRWRFVVPLWAWYHPVSLTEVQSRFRTFYPKASDQIIKPTIQELYESHVKRRTHVTDESVHRSFGWGLTAWVSKRTLLPQIPVSIVQ